MITAIIRIETTASVVRVIPESMTRSAFLLFHSLLCLGLVGFQSAGAAPWDVELAADLSAIYTDNLRLRPSGAEDDDTVFMVAPTLGLNTDGDRIQADLRYRPEAYFYGEASESDDVFHVLDTSMTTAVLKDALFIYASAINFQSVVSPELGFPTTNVPITGNRADSTVFEIRPYWEQGLGFADVFAEIGYVDSRYDKLDDSLAKATTDNVVRSGSLNLNNHSQQAGLAWGLAYVYRRIDYDEAVPWDTQRASTDLGYWFNGVMRVFVSGGIESSYENFLDPRMEDDFWEAGFQYKPNQRLNLEVAAGERSFGNSYRLQLSYELRRGQTSLSYTEQPAGRGELGNDRRPLIASDNLDLFLDELGGSDRFVQKRGEWQTGISLAKSDISLRVFVEERDLRTTDVGDALETQRYGGAAFRWSWQPGSKTSVGLSTDFAKRKEGDSESDLMRVAIDYSYQISQKLSVVLLAQHSDEESSGSLSRDYVENQLRLTLRTEFL